MPRLTPSGKKTALADVEDKLKAEYGDNKGAIFGTLNRVGLMRGNRSTAKGRAAAASKVSRPGTRYSVKKTRHFTGA